MSHVFEISVEDLPKNKRDDFSFHQAPSSNLLKELRDFCGVNVRIIACQVKYVPEIVKPGLSQTLREAIPKAPKIVMESLESSFNPK